MENNATASNNTEERSIGQIDQIDFNQLSADIANALTEQIGGEFTVHLQRFDRGQVNGLKHEMSVEFAVKDQSTLDRYRASREGQMLSSALK